MKQSIKHGVIGVALLGMGLARMGFESELHGRLQRERLLPPALELEVKERIGQTSAGVAMGGLRTLVATFLNLRAFRFFTENRWPELEDTYQTIVALAPQTRYYWDSGAWHMAYNASVSYLNDKRLPQARRKELWRGSIFKGKEFLERGIRNNPEDVQLMSVLGCLLVDSNKFIAFKEREKAFEEAAGWFERAQADGGARGPMARFRLYALARVPGREREAYELAQQLFGQGASERTTTMKCVYYVLESRHVPEGDLKERLLRIFGTSERAYQTLSRFWQRPSEYYPMDGVASGMALLEEELKLPEDKRVLRQSLPLRKSVDSWLRE